MNHFHTFCSRLRRGGKNLNGSTAVVSESQRKQIGIAAVPLRCALNAMENEGYAAGALRKAEPSGNGSKYKDGAENQGRL